VLRIGPLPVDLPYQDGIEQFLIGLGVLSEWDALEADFPGITLRRLFFTLTPAQLADLQKRARHMRPDGFDDLTRYFYVDTPSGSDPALLLARIESLPVIAEAYLESPPTPPPSPPPAGAQVSTQAYLDPAEAGIGARAVWAVFDGAKGAGMRFADVEKGWHISKDAAGTLIVNHVNVKPDPPTPELQPVVLPVWGGECASLGDHKHGMQTIGVVRALEPRGSCAGVAQESNGWCVSEFRPTGTHDRADAISAAAYHLAVGDVLLIESQVLNDPTVKDQDYPVEIESANRNAISVATAVGIVVIEATGNGVDDPGPIGAAPGDLDRHFPGLVRGSAGFLDTGAVLVAGASSGARHIRLPNTRYGSRVDCFAWGEKVETTDVDTLPKPDCSGAESSAYEADYGGSSAASAIIAGAALVVQGIHRAEYGFPASAWRVRALLRDPDTGTKAYVDQPVLPGVPPVVDDKVGVMPDLERIAPLIVPRIRPEIYIRDHVGDTGAPHDGPISNSPDIIVRRAPVADPTAEFGFGSGREDDDLLSDTVRAGQDHTLYVRLRNLAAAGSGPVEVNVYWSEPGTLIFPQEWHHIGADHTKPSVVMPDVPPNDQLTVSDAITWLGDEVPGSGHYCFIALVGCPGDPAPHPLHLDASWDVFHRFIRNNNNVTWRNFDVIDVAMMARMLRGEVLPFFVAAARDRALRMILEAKSDLPPQLIPRIEVPAELDVYLDRPIPGHPLPGPGRARPADPGHPLSGGGVLLDIPATRGRWTALGAGVLPPGGRWRCGLRLDGSVPGAPVDGMVTVRQLWQVDSKGDRRREVGRITWRFVP
jgi:hypothetical protein